MEGTLIDHLKMSQINTQKKMQEMELKQNNDLRNSITQLDTPLPATPDFSITTIIEPVAEVITPSMEASITTVSINEITEVSDEI